jgi:uncharacterized membrane protein YkvA (DUF1232 family)
MIFKKKRFPLPKFPDYIPSGFNRLRETVSDEAAQALQLELFDYMGRVEKEKTEDPMVNLQLAREIAQVSSYLLEHYKDFGDKQKSLIVAGVRYFISDGDGVADFEFASGLIDDAQVINHVLEEVGVEDKFIEVDKHRY